MHRSPSPSVCSSSLQRNWFTPSMPVWERHAFFVKHAIGMEVHADAVDSLAEAKKHRSASPYVDIFLLKIR